MGNKGARNASLRTLSTPTNWNSGTNWGDAHYSLEQWKHQDLKFELVPPARFGGGGKCYWRWRERRAVPDKSV